MSITKFFKQNLDAFIIFSGFPNVPKLEIALVTDIKLLDLYDELAKSILFSKHLYSKKVLIPARTYRGEKTDMMPSMILQNIPLMTYLE